MNSFRTLNVVSAICLFGASGMFSTANAQDQWTRTAGPFGGGVAEVHMWGDTGIALATQVYRTTDGGRSWKLSYPYTATSCCIDAGGRAWLANPYYGDFPLQVSTDYGLNWHNDASNLVRMALCAIIAPGDRLAVQLDTLGFFHMFESRDPNYQHWVAKATRGLPRGMIANSLSANPITHTAFFSIQDSSAIILGFRSTNNGDDWTPMSLAGTPANARLVEGAQSIFVDSSGVIIIGTQIDNGSDQTILGNARSTDDGNTWTRADSGLPPFCGMYGIARSATGALIGQCWKRIPGRNDTPVGLYSSTDQGVSWTAVATTGLPPAWGWGIDAASNGTLILYMEHGSGGLYRSTDNGQSWELDVDGIQEGVAVSVAADHLGHVFACLPESGLYRTSNHGSSWSRLGNGAPQWGWMNVCVDDSNVVFAADTLSGVFRSTDDGDSWESIVNGLGSLRCRRFVATHAGTDLAFTDMGVYRSTTHGAQWTPVTTSIPNEATVNGVAVREDDLLIAATDLGPYRSTDDGETWTLQVAGLSYPNCYGIGFSCEGSALLGNASGAACSIARSTDNGLHWDAIPSRIPNEAGGTFVNDIICSRTGRLIALRSRAQTYFLASTDDGMSWNDDRDPNLNITILPGFQLASDTGGFVYVATSFGVLRTTPIPNDDVSSPSDLARSAAITVSPNPSGSQSTISYDLEETSDVLVELVDCLGRSLFSDLQHHLSPGTHQLTIETSLLPSGIYREVLRTAHGVRSGTLCVMR